MAMAGSKKRVVQHLIDERGQRLLEASIPEHWILRAYRPDYGLDFALEIFSCAGSDSSHETLGEHIFIQLKSVQNPEMRALTLYSRVNVEKEREALDKANPVGEIDVVSFQLEISELLTVERMSVAVPVLLVVADLSRGKCFFVCLNDYVDKILVPRYLDYSVRKSRAIHIPMLNTLSRDGHGRDALRWYAKRAKLYSAFMRFGFQLAELEYARGSADIVRQARYFADRISHYDFWHDLEMWRIVGRYSVALDNLIRTGKPGMLEVKVAPGNGLLPSGGGDIELISHDILALWSGLALLGRNYEDVCREWFLPTALGYLSTFQYLGGLKEQGGRGL
jgi:hypothetical protein